MSVVGLSCRQCLLHAAVALALCASLVSPMVDPLAQFAVTTDVDGADNVALAFTAGSDADEMTAPRSMDRVPDFRFDDMRAERQASSHNWRVSPVFEARGPPV